MRVVVTGAAGFIGSHLTKKLLFEGHDVLAIDNFSDYYSVELKHLRVNELISSHGGKITELDLCNLSELKIKIAKFNPDGIVHLAAQPGVRLNASQYHRYTQDNLVAFTNLFQTIIECGFSNFIYASSSSVYGNSKNNQLSESLTNLHPVSFYGATKLSNEILASTSDEIPNLSAIGLRFFTVYGPYGRPDMAYFRLLAHALAEYKFELYGDGSVKRDFTFVDDTISAIYKLLGQQVNGRFRGSHIFNIGGGKPASMLDMITEIENLTTSKIRYRSLSAHKGDVDSTNANTDKLLNAIDFVPQISLSEGLGKTLAWSSQENILSRLSSWSNSV